MTRLLLMLMRFAGYLPLWALRGAGSALGLFLYVVAIDRRAVARANLEACFPEQDDVERRRLMRETFRLFGQGFMDRVILWHGSPGKIRALVRVTGEEHLARLAGRPVILLAPHFVGLDAAWSRLTLDRKMVTIYASQKNRAFNSALLAARRRFNEPLLLSRQDGIRAAYGALRKGLPFYYLPDMDFGARDALFVPFFGVPAATVTAVSRLARLSGAAVLPCVTTLTADGYRVDIDAPWDDFPGADLAADTRRVNAFVERMVCNAPTQYHWLHKRFKTRPPGEAPFYPNN